MKARIFILLFSTLIFCFIAGNGGADNQPERRVMKYLAVMDFTCDPSIGKPGCKSLTDIVIAEFVRIGKYTVIDRANRDKILSEQGFQQTGCVEESCTVDAGRLLGVGKIVVGSITKLGDTYIISLQLVNVQTAAVEIAQNETCKCSLDGLIESVRKTASNLMGEKQTGPPSQPGGTAIPTQGSSKAVETSKLAKSGLFPSFQKGKVMVIVYRLTAGTGFASSPTMFDGERTIGKISNGSYFYYETDPGLHNFKVKNYQQVHETGAAELMANTTIFIKVFPSMNGFDITIENPAAGLQGATKCKYKASSGHQEF